MTLHFIHVSKTGGTAVKQALRDARYVYRNPKKAARAPETPYGQIMLHRHAFTLRDVPRGDYAFFLVRDPISRFFSGFYSRLNKGQPRYYFEWTAGERTAFEAFPTPQLLAGALAADDGKQREHAELAMARIRHLRPMGSALGRPINLWARRHRIVYIGRQETLAADWEQLKALLGIPETAPLPSDPVRAHRREPSFDTSVGPDALQALKQWYRRDQRLVDYCEEIRRRKGWGVP